MVRSQATVDLISENVNKNPKVNNSFIITGIQENTLISKRAAHAILYDNKYMVHVGDYVWILDLQYSNLEEGIYCWYPYSSTVIKPGQMAIYDGDLYISDNTALKIYKSSAEYSDNGTAINAYWTSPLLYVGARYIVKKFETLWITFKGQPEGSFTLTWLTDEGEEDSTVTTLAAMAFDYANIDYGAWIYGVPFYPSTQKERIGFRGEYIQWRVRNNTLDQGMTILGQVLKYTYKKEVR
jgi:hypothetical protein